MTKNNSSATENPTERELIITRTFNAPREVVWRAWNDPAHIEKWWGPETFSTRVEEMDFRPGGKWRYVMIDQDGNEYPAVGVFREIVVPERIVTSDEFGEELIDQAAPGDFPTGIMLTVSFEDLDDKTKVTLTYVHRSVEDRVKHETMGVVAGWNSSLDKLVVYLVKM